MDRMFYKLPDPMLSMKEYFLSVADAYTRLQIPVLRVMENGVDYAVSSSALLASLLQAGEHYNRMPEKRVGILATNSYHWFINAMGVMLAGKDLILLDCNMPDKDLVHLLTYTQADKLISTEDVIEDMPEIARRWNASALLETALETEQDYAKSRTAFAAFEPAVQTEEGPSFMCFTSGTSSSAKGVEIPMHTLMNKPMYTRDIGLGQACDRAFIPLPLYHIYAFSSVFYQLELRTTVCIGSKTGNFLPELASFNPNVMYMVAPLLKHMLDKDKIPPALRRINTGGSPCSPDLVKRLRDAGVAYQNGYGLSETLGWICGSALEGDTLSIYPLKGVHMVVSDEGELGVYISYHMKEYYLKEEDTKRVMQGDLLWTGDAAVMNPDGSVQLRGRLRDTLVLPNGEKVHIEDKDTELIQLEGVKEATVIGSEDGMIAIVVPEDGFEWAAVEKTLEKYNRGFSPVYKIRKFVEWHEPFPRTSTGKLRRYQLEKQYAEKQAH